MLNVTKADGTKQPFDRSKIVRTALRMRASPEEAEEVARKIESKVYSGIPTKKILQMLFTYMRQIRPHMRHVTDLRTAISLLRSKPDFEQFVSQLLLAEGYNVATNRIIPGKCIEHEIDVVATKPGETVYVEVKHHLQPHTFTGLDVFLQANSTLQDLRDGFLATKHAYNFQKALVVCNTKISDYAKRYASCRGILHLGWRSPENRGLEFLIEENRLYPITFLRTLDADTQAKLGDNGIVTLKQILDREISELKNVTKISRDKLQVLVSNAREILQG